jgi:transcriptional regulator with XRE-family HTH domain
MSSITCHKIRKPLEMGVMKFHEKLEREMEKRNLRIADLARMSGVNYSTIRSWLRQKVTPNVESLVKVAQVLGVPAEYLGDPHTAPMPEPSPFDACIQDLLRVLGPARALHALMDAATNLELRKLGLNTVQPETVGGKPTQAAPGSKSSRRGSGRTKKP